MKRRDFINNVALTIAGSTLVNFSGITPVFASGVNSVVHPYDSNRVVRIYDPTVTDFGFKSGEIFWKTINRPVLKSMLNKTLIRLSGEKDESKAWRKILTGSKSIAINGKKIAVKVNFNNTIRDINQTLNNSPIMIMTLAKSLIDAGVNEGDITIFDHSRPFPDDFKNYIRSNKFNELKLKGKTDDINNSSKTILLTDNIGIERDGKKTEDFPIPQCVIDADYLINLHLVKIHYSGVTGAMKNLFGMCTTVDFYFHYEKIKSFNGSNHLADISLNEEIKKRAKLNISEFIFGGHTPDTIDKYTNGDFFPGGNPCSLIASTSPFYQDLVLYNMIRAEYQTCIPVLKRFNTMGPDTWLQNSAKLYAPWKFAHAEFIKSSIAGMPSNDLKFNQIDYISILNS